MNELTSILLQVLRGLPLNLMLVDTQGKVLAVTEICLRNVLKRERQTVLGKLLPMAFGCAEQSGSVEILSELANLHDALDKPIVSQLKIRLPGSGDSLWSVRVQPLFDDDGAQIAALLLFECMEHIDLRDLESKQNAENKLALVQDMLHSTKNVLQSIDGMLQVLAKKCELQNIYIESLDMIRGEVAAQILQIIEFNQECSSQSLVGMFSLNQLAEEVVLQQKALFLTSRVELKTELDDKVPPIWLDKQRIKNVLVNCLHNSREAILQKGQPGGLVIIKTQLDENRQIARILIEDNGVGLTPEQQANFFKPYYTTKPQGTGIGTSINQVVVTMHGGTISVSGKPDEGCCVCIELPLQSEQLFSADDYLAIAAKLGMEF